jgi:RNA polymerase sigma-70 factor (ECF subfamily)
MVYRKYAPVALARSALVVVAPAARRRDPHPLPDQERNPALADLFRRYAPYVATIGSKLLGRDDDELDDLVQDVFIEAHRGLGQLRDVHAAKAWLARITVRRATRWLRRARRRSFFSLDAVADEAALEAALIDATDTPEERAHVVSTYQWLDRLPVHDRVVWVLRHIEGETLDAICELCACSKSTVQRRMRAAENALKDLRRKEEAR